MMFYALKGVRLRHPEKTRARSISNLYPVPATGLWLHV